MNSPVIRLVCGSCLRSVEITEDGLSRPPEACPYCGGLFESLQGNHGAVSPALSTPLSLELSPSDSTPQIETVETTRMDYVGRFQIRETLGGGGFGLVHKAYDPRLDREVALKVLKEQKPSARVVERFFREARAAARLDHPNIVPLHDAGRDDGRCWIAYQFVAGSNLARYQEHQSLDHEAAARIVRALAEALDHAHKRGVFHRDMKPSNVIIDATGQPRLTDFGLAKRVDFESTLTHEGTVLGTPAYMSPEQADGRSHQADARSDIYSLGVILYELLCGQRPIELPSGVPIWRAAQLPPAPPIRSVDRSVPARLDRICRRALARDPSDRYPDAQSMLVDLDQWLEPRQPSARRARRRAEIVSFLLVSIAILALVSFANHGARTSADSTAVLSLPSRAPQAPQPTPSPPSAATESPPSAVVPSSETRPERLVGNRSSRHYHRPTCSAISKMLDIHRIEFSSSAEAQSQGYTPCARCRPAPDTASAEEVELKAGN